MSTYVLETAPGPVFTDPAKPRTLRKYLDWDPKGGDANGTIIDTEKTATVAAGSKLFSSGRGVIYEITSGGVLKSYKDETASGGSLLTPVKTYGTGWNSFQRTWASGGRIFGQAAGGEIAVYAQSDSAAGGGTITLLASKIASTSAAAVAIGVSDDVWMAGSVIYTLRSGEITAWPYSERTAGLPPNQIVHPGVGAGTVIGSGLNDAVLAWSPGPGTIHTSTGSNDYTGIIRGYVGTSSLTLANAEVKAGLYGDVFADTATCLADMAEGQPYFGTRPDDGGAPVVAAPSEDDQDPAPEGSRFFKGRFTLGDGKPASGLQVAVEATDVGADDGSTAELPLLGTATTGADGSWSIPLPAQLPQEVQLAADANGGAVNAVASAMGVTSNGVAVNGVDHVSAAPDTAPTAVRKLVGSAASDDVGRAAKLFPLISDDSPSAPEPSDAEYAKSWAYEQERATVDLTDGKPIPEWQNATGPLPVNYDPYIVNGVDTKGLAVTPYDGGCDRTKKVVQSKKIYYTAVAEGHAYWDSKASVDYDSKLASIVDVAVKTGSNWSVQGTSSLGSSMGISTGYTNRGPYFAKQWKVPIEYKKIKETWKCGGNNTFTRYVVAPGGYKVPSGGATGTYGKDVRSKDGYAGWRNSPQANRAYVSAGSYFQISKNKSHKMAGAVSAFGVSLSASTQYDKEHRQRITAGTNNNERHYIWGRNGSVSGKPGVFYSY
ncbi:peptidase associated/transthyretin-like domain-containing protein [Streptomyces niveus]|uniref:hypothetical protein n=1 Tax=Streptomyces niveus TaxID=193462 RepID=UPI0036A9C954